jgi:hypothetical protein
MFVASQSYDIGMATAQVLVDTPQSQVVGEASSVSPGGGLALQTLGVQATMLAGLMVEGTIKTDIAQRAGLNPSQLIGISPAVTVPSASGSASASSPSPPSVPSGPNVFALTTQILTDSAGQNTLPIIEITAQAPDQSKAVRLAGAAVAGLQAFVSSNAVDERIPNADRLRITSLGVSAATTQSQGPSPFIGLLVALGVLLLGCASILWVRALIRGWGGASEVERLGFGEPLEDDTEPAPREVALPVARSRMLGEPLEGDAELARHELPPPIALKRRTVVGANRLGLPPASSNAASTTSTHGGLTLAPDESSFPAEATPGQDPDPASQQQSSRLT